MTTESTTTKETTETPTLASHFTGVSHLMPQSLSEKIKMADVFSKSGLMPAGFKTPAQVLIALQMGHELGIPPMRAIQNIYVVNGRPTLSADMMLAIAMKTGEIELFDDSECDAKRAVIRLKRRGYPLRVSEFTMEQAKRAGLLGKDTWQKWPERMLRARALAFAVRDRFADVMAGLYTPDEIAGIPQGAVLDSVDSSQMIDVTPEAKQIAVNMSDSDQGDKGEIDRLRAKAFARMRNLGWSKDEQVEFCRMVTGIQSRADYGTEDWNLVHSVLTQRENQPHPEPAQAPPQAPVELQNEIPAQEEPDAPQVFSAPVEEPKTETLKEAARGNKEIDALNVELAPSTKKSLPDVSGEAPIEMLQKMEERLNELGVTPENKLQRIADALSTRNRKAVVRDISELSRARVALVIKDLERELAEADENVEVKAEEVGAVEVVGENKE